MTRLTVEDCGLADVLISAIVPHKPAKSLCDRDKCPTTPMTFRAGGGGIVADITVQWYREGG